MPSVRHLASTLGISTFTVADSYSRLVQQGLILAKRGDGYYVAKTSRPLPQAPTPIPDARWLTDHKITPEPQVIQPGCGWLPTEWYPTPILQRALRQQGREPDCGNGYGHSAGWRPLRQHLWQQHHELGILVEPEGVLLTQGASQALALVIQAELQAGDTVVVDDPGYCNLLAMLQHAGMRVCGVPWTPQGPDCNALAELLARERPRAFFTNPRQHNPTGASYSAATAFRVLQLATQHHCLIVEDDVSAALTLSTTPTLAALAGLENIIYISSFAKALAPGLRVGYLLATAERTDRLLRYKVMNAIASSELAERLVLRMVNDPETPKEQQRLRDRLLRAGERWQHGAGADPVAEFLSASRGIFLMGEASSITSGRHRAERSGLGRGAVAGPGQPVPSRCLRHPLVALQRGLQPSTAARFPATLGSTTGRVIPPERLCMPPFCWARNEKAGLTTGKKALNTRKTSTTKTIRYGYI